MVSVFLRKFFVMLKTPGTFIGCHIVQDVTPYTLRCLESHSVLLVSFGNNVNRVGRLSVQYFPTLFVIDKCMFAGLSDAKRKSMPKLFEHFKGSFSGKMAMKKDGLVRQLKCCARMSILRFLWFHRWMIISSKVLQACRYVWTSLEIRSKARFDKGRSSCWILTVC